MSQPYNSPCLTTIYFNITDRCNLRCRHCWLEAEYDGLGENRPSAINEELTVEQIKRPIQEAMDLGLGLIKFTGGEPFLRKDILDFVNFFASLNLKLFFETNATLLDEETVSKLPRDHITDISVSLDSYEQTLHDTLRGVKGSFEKAINGIKLLLRYKMPVQIIFALYADNLSKLWDTIDVVRDIGIGLIKINPITRLGRARGIDEKKFLNPRELLQLERKIEERAYQDIEVFLDLPLAFKSTRYFFSTKRTSCCAINSLLGILSDGTVSICGIGRTQKDLVMGNIKKDSIKDIWQENPILRKIRESIPEKLEGVCKKCILKNFCLGCCPADTYAKTKSFTAAYHFCEETYAQNLFPKARLLEERLINAASFAKCT